MTVGSERVCDVYTLISLALGSGVGVGDRVVDEVVGERVGGGGGGAHTCTPWQIAGPQIGDVSRPIAAINNAVIEAPTLSSIHR